MKIKDALFYEFINKLSKGEVVIFPGDTLNLHLDIVMTIDKKRYKELEKTIQMWKKQNERSAKIERQEIPTGQGQEGH